MPQQAVALLQGLRLDSALARRQAKQQQGALPLAVALGSGLAQVLQQLVASQLQLSRSQLSERVPGEVLAQVPGEVLAQVPGAGLQQQVLRLHRRLERLQVLEQRQQGQ